MSVTDSTKQLVSCSNDFILQIKWWVLKGSTKSLDNDNYSSLHCRDRHRIFIYILLGGNAAKKGELRLLEKFKKINLENPWECNPSNPTPPPGVTKTQTGPD